MGSGQTDGVARKGEWPDRWRGQTGGVARQREWPDRGSDQMGRGQTGGGARQREGPGRGSGQTGEGPNGEGPDRGRGQTGRGARHGGWGRKSSMRNTAKPNMYIMVVIHTSRHFQGGSADAQRAALHIKKYHHKYRNTTSMHSNRQPTLVLLSQQSSSLTGGCLKRPHPNFSTKHEPPRPMKMSKTKHATTANFTISINMGHVCQTSPLLQEKIMYSLCEVTKMTYTLCGGYKMDVHFLCGG